MYSCSFERKKTTINTCHVHILGKTKGPSPSDLRGKLIDGSDNIEENFEALTEAVQEEFQIFPDETTSEKLFNGIKFKDLPYVTIKCNFNHTRFWVNKADGTLLYYTSPQVNGFLNAQKRTAVAAQATGHIVGQKLRLLNMRTVRLRVSGFNAGRISSIKGLVQSGTNVVCISDITTVDWHWAQRAKKPKRRN